MTNEEAKYLHDEAVGKPAANVIVDIVKSDQGRLGRFQLQPMKNKLILKDQDLRKENDITPATNHPKSYLRSPNNVDKDIQVQERKSLARKIRRHISKKASRLEKSHTWNREHRKKPNTPKVGKYWNQNRSEG